MLDSNQPTRKTDAFHLDVPAQGPSGAAAKQARGYLASDRDDTIAKTKEKGRLSARSPVNKTRAEYITHARMSPTHTLAPRLFRPIPRGQKYRDKLFLRYQVNDQCSIEFKSFDTLGANDLLVLQALVALAGPYGQAVKLEPQETKQEAQSLREKLEPKWDAMRDSAIALETSLNELAEVMGRSTRNGTQNEKTIESIERLSMIKIIFADKYQRRGFSLMSHFVTPKHSRNGGQVKVMLNPLLAEAITGETGHTRIELNEVRQLRSDIAHLLHNRLCGWINPGLSGEVKLSTLYKGLWEEAEQVKPDTIKKRKQRMRKSIYELRSAGWEVNEPEKDKYKLRRPYLLE